VDKNGLTVNFGVKKKICKLLVLKLLHPLWIYSTPLEITPDLEAWIRTNWEPITDFDRICDNWMFFFRNKYFEKFK